jgi:hypothetical protein
MNNNANNAEPDPAPSSVMHHPPTDAETASQVWTINRHDVPEGITLPFHFNVQHRVICQCGHYVGGNRSERPGRHCPGSWCLDEARDKLLRSNAGDVIPVYNMMPFKWDPTYMVVCQCGLFIGKPSGVTVVGLNEIKINTEGYGQEESVDTEETSDLEETEVSVEGEEGVDMEDMEEADDHVKEAEHVNNTGTTYETAVDLSSTSTNLDGESSSNALDLTRSDSHLETTI